MKKFIYGLSMLLSFGIIAHSAQAQTVKEETKTSTSHKGKDAAIGAGAGAVIGGVASHQHAKGAVIGGVVGAGAGYLYGRHHDKKHPTQKTVYKKTVRRG